MPKKTKLDFYQEIRRKWDRSPITKVKDSDKLYDRKKFKKDTKEYTKDYKD